MKGWYTVMKYLTMVARSGNPKIPEKMSYTLIGDDYSIHNMKADKILAGLADGKLVITNMAASAKGLVSTNGAIDKYTTFDESGNLIGVPRNVILGRLETNGDLTGYEIFSAKGNIMKISVSDAAALAAKGLIANGKLRSTSAGYIVSSIGGNYPLTNTKIEVKTDNNIKIDLVFFGTVASGRNSMTYGGVTLTGKNMAFISKLYDELSKNNSVVTNNLVNKFGFESDEIGSFEMKPAPGAGFYGIYTTDRIKKLIETYKKSCKLGQILISYNDCDSDDGESIVALSVKDGSVKTVQSGSAKSDKNLKKTVETVKGLLAS